ncbi:MAG: helix-turn-helix transcriptional regulator [Clostridia bacterium]
MKLKYLRKQKGLTQKKASEVLEINYETYKSYENEIRKPPIEVLKNLAKYFNVSLDYLCDNELKYLEQYQLELISEIKVLSKLECFQVQTYIKTMKETYKTTNTDILKLIKKYNEED